MSSQRAKAYYTQAYIKTNQKTINDFSGKKRNRNEEITRQLLLKIMHVIISMCKHVGQINF